MAWIDRITALAVILSGVTAVPLVAQTLLMPTLVAWEAELAAAFMRGLPI